MKKTFFSVMYTVEPGDIRIHPELFSDGKDIVDFLPQFLMDHQKFDASELVCQCMSNITEAEAEFTRSVDDAVETMISSTAVPSKDRVILDQEIREQMSKVNPFYLDLQRFENVIDDIMQDAQVYAEPADIRYQVLKCADNADINLVVLDKPDVFSISDISIHRVYHVCK